jgi:hypothetical protein
VAITGENVLEPNGLKKSNWMSKASSQIETPYVYLMCRES